MDEFNWRRAVEHYSDELLAIVAQLVAMAGMRFGEMPETLPRGLYLRILSILRPAEYAARRIIVMAACKLEWQIRAPTVTSPRLRGEVDLPRAAKPGGMANRVRGRNTETGEDGTPAFALFDPNKKFGDPWLTAAEIAAFDDLNKDIWTGSYLPRDEPVSATNLCRRIRALAHALDDLDGQAKRLARWRARRHLETCKPKLWSPIRPGRPPGYTRKPKTAIEEILKDLHFLARDAWDTRGPPASEAKPTGGTNNLARQRCPDSGLPLTNEKPAKLKGGTETS